MPAPRGAQQGPVRGERRHMAGVIHLQGAQIAHRVWAAIIRRGVRRRHYLNLQTQL